MPNGEKILNISNYQKNANPNHMSYHLTLLRMATVKVHKWQYVVLRVWGLGKTNGKSEGQPGLYGETLSQKKKMLARMWRDWKDWNP
jgi:hypothetical protein